MGLFVHFSLDILCNYLVLFLVWKDNKPKTAKAAGVGAIVGVVLCVIYYLLMVCLGVGTAMYGGF